MRWNYKAAQIHIFREDFAAIQHIPIARSQLLEQGMSLTSTFMHEFYDLCRR